MQMERLKTWRYYRSVKRRRVSFWCDYTWNLRERS